MTEINFMFAYTHKIDEQFQIKFRILYYIVG